MKIDELSHELRQPFSKKRGYGITKVKTEVERFQNIYFVVPPKPPCKLKCDLPVELLNETLKVIGSLSQVKEMSDLDKLINYLFVRREVVQSSRLEGTWSTIDHALTPGDISEANEGRNEHHAVRCYASLLEDIVENAIEKKESIFTKELITDIQKGIVENDPKSSGIPGKIRQEGQKGAIVTIGGGLRVENSTYNPTPASEVDRCLDEVLEWLRNEELAQLGDAAIGGLSLPIRIAIGHSHFEAVHPFSDGNGRTGRTLWPIQMVCSGYMPLYLSGYVEVMKDNYGKALEEAQKKLNYIPIIEFVCNAIIESDIENKRTKEMISKLESMWQERGKFRANSGPQKTLSFLLSTPIISSLTLEKGLGLSKTACINTINALVGKKIIRYRKTENRKKIYAAEELISILARPFGSDIELALEKAQILLEI